MTLGSLKPKDNVRIIEKHIRHYPFFYGDQFALVDTAYAPLFIRYKIINSIAPVFSSSDFPKLSTWSDVIFKLDVVESSVVDEFTDLFKNKIKVFDGYLANQLV